ncbi:cytidylate kinase [Kineococcus rhizosphaerae]|uniref:Cytidylate kinase n=1 Tax=Kineococcus rhizosphaerae TaxID=559628 RepID=A0A2T0R9F9_9ACTN|nr:(d)CMP kinase [Kineococcus rhizosphaerae]PRY17806.1 cytidylate kinase [Kineococcus rhizosphaerae]
MTTALVVAVDGPSGSGKSSVSRAAARALGVAFLDTGAMYRALTWAALRAGVDLADADAVARHARTVALVMGTDPAAPTVAAVVDGVETDLTEAVRSPEVTANVSALAAVPAVRSDLVLRQRALIESACLAPAPGREPGVVAEGRDITTVVAPRADVRILLTADESVRLARRAHQDLGAADAAALEATRRGIVERDRVDSRTTSFTAAADGVVTVDSTHLDFDGTVAAVLEVVAQATGTSATGAPA